MKAANHAGVDGPGVYEVEYTIPGHAGNMARVEAECAGHAAELVARLLARRRPGGRVVKGSARLIEARRGFLPDTEPNPEDPDGEGDLRRLLEARKEGVS